MSTQTELKTDDMDVQLERNPGCQVTMKVTLSPSKTQQAHREAVKRVKKEVSIPGFRKGRAPDAKILNQFGSYVDSEFKDLVVRQAFESSCDLAKLYPFDEHSLKRPKMDVCSQEEGATLEFEFECNPEVPEMTFSELKLKKATAPEVTDEMVEGTLQDIRSAHADWEEVEGREIQAEDYVDLTIESMDEPGKVICDDKRFELRSGKTGKWLIDLLVGKKVGDTIEGTSQLEEGQEEQIKNFKPTNCKITVNAIRKIILPEVNDELANKVGVDSADQLKTRIREDLERGSEQAARGEMLQQLDDAILEAYPFELPHSLVEGEKRNRLAGRKAQLLAEGESEESLKEKADQLSEEAAKDVDRSLRLFFLLREVASKEKIQASEEELMSELSRQLWSVPEHERVIDMNMEPQEMRSRLMVKLMMDNTRSFILDRVTVE